MLSLAEHPMAFPRDPLLGIDIRLHKIRHPGQRVDGPPEFGHPGPLDPLLVPEVEPRQGRIFSALKREPSGHQQDGQSEPPRRSHRA